MITIDMKSKISFAVSAVLACFAIFLLLPPTAMADDDEESIADINRFIKRYPDNWEGYYKSAAFYQHHDVRESALENYSKAIELNPKNGQLYLGRAEMYLMTTRFDKAIADTDAAIEVFPKWPEAYMKRARAESSVEDFLSAKNDIEHALTLLPNSDDALDNLAGAYDGIGNHAKAIEAATKAVIMSEQTGRGGLYYSLQNRAFYWTHAHEYQRAYQDISQSIMAKPKSSQVWAYLAYALAMDNKMDKAKDAMKICHSMETFLPRAFRLKAEMHRAGGEWIEAVRDYKTSTSREPGYGPGFAQQAIAEIALGQYAEAETDLEKAISKVPKSVLSYCYLALAEDQLGKNDEAKEHLEKAIALDPDFAMNYALRARINLHQADYEKAAEDCNKALKLDPFLGDAYAAASTALENSNKHDEATKFLDTAHKMGWKDLEKELQTQPAPSGTSISIALPNKPDLAAIMTETEKNIGEAAPP